MWYVHISCVLLYCSIWMHCFKRIQKVVVNIMKCKWSCMPSLRERNCCHFSDYAMIFRYRRSTLLVTWSLYSEYDCVGLRCLQSIQTCGRDDLLVRYPLCIHALVTYVLYINILYCVTICTDCIPYLLCACVIN